MSELLEQVELLLDAYPDMEPIDLYKFIHQRCFASAKAHPVQVQSYQALVDQAHAMDLSDGEEEEVVELLCHRRELARINLRPYLRAGGSLRRLFEAYARSAEDAADAGATREDLEAALMEVREALRAGKLDAGFEATEYSRTLAKMKQKGYPSGSHSEVYQEEYSPAYRLVFLKRLSP